MFNKSISEAMHLLMAVHMQGEEFYLSQIEGIIKYYGQDIISEAESNLYGTRAFQICMTD